MEPTTAAQELADAYWKLKRSRIRISRAASSRASSIGELCERKLFYARTASELAAPHGPALQAIFDLGNGLEPFVIRELEDLGAEILSRQQEKFDRERELSAHLDVKLRMRTWSRALPAEIKGLNPYSAESIETIDDIRDSHQVWIRKYYDQLQTYIHFDDAPAGVFVLLNKVSGQIGFIDCPRDQERIDSLLAKAERIRDAVRANAPPDRHTSSDCERCPYLAVCMPAQQLGEGIKVFDDDEAESLIRRRLELADAKSEFDSVDRQLKKLLPEAEEVAVGPYLVKGKQQSRDGYTVKPTTFWTRSYIPLGPGEEKK